MMLSQSVERAAQVNGDGEATVFNDRRRTWSCFRDRVSKLAAGLAELGIGAGDRVALLGLNTDHYLEALYAIWWVGGVVTPLNTRWSAVEHLWAIQDSGSKVILSDEFFDETLAELRPKLGDRIRYVRLGESDDVSRGLGAEGLIARCAPISPVVRDPGVLAGIYYTGGTTGRPKGVMVSELALWSSAISFALELRLDRSARYLHVAPAFHLADGMMLIAVTIVAGCHLLVSAFKPDEILAFMKDEAVTETLLVPTMVRMLLDHDGFDSRSVQALRTLIYGASPMPAQTHLDATVALPAVRFVQAYGQTELAPLCAVLHEDEYRARAGREASLPAGRASFCVQVKVCDEHGREMPRGQDGEVWVRGPNAMMGYWNEPGLTELQMAEGWVKTGDIAHLDSDGFLFISDRAKDMIISGGENVFSVEVERAIASHPTVHDVAVIGVPDPVYGERVHAIVVLHEGAALELEDLQAHCRILISGYKLPRSLDVRIAPLPLSAAGKVLKSDLRKPYWAGRARSVN